MSYYKLSYNKLGAFWCMSYAYVQQSAKEIHKNAYNTIYILFSELQTLLQAQLSFNRNVKIALQYNKTIHAYQRPTVHLNIYSEL